MKNENKSNEIDFLTHFRDCRDWVLVNDFTIRDGTETESDPKPRHTNCVPNRLNLELKDISLVFGVRWNDWNHNDTTGEKGHHGSDWSIHGRGLLKDRITVFDLENGVVDSFNIIRNVRISESPEGLIGGKRNATLLDGGAYTGRFSPDVPEKGLMEGEPGHIYFYDFSNALEDSISEEFRNSGLGTELHIEKNIFSELIECLRNSYNDIEKINISLCAELFISDTDAALLESSESWHNLEYGIRTSRVSHGRARARIDDFDLIWKKNNQEDY